MNSISELNKEKIESNKIKSKGLFVKLKSDYFLRKLFNNLLKRNHLI